MCVRERDDQVGRKNQCALCIPPMESAVCLVFHTSSSNSVRKVTSPDPPVSHFLCFLHPASSPSESIQAGSCLLFTVIDPRYEPHTSPISRFHICYFPDFYKNDHNWNETFFSIFYTQFNKTLQVSFSVFHNQSPSISSSPCTHCLSILLLSASYIFAQMSNPVCVYFILLCFRSSRKTP